MMTQLIEAQWSEVFDKPMPRQRFFTPNENFWNRLDALKEYFDMIVDCGTGNGDLPREAVDRHIKMAGVDIMPRDGNGPCEVQIIPAHRMPFSDRIWALVCRPNHSGWCDTLQTQARNSGAGFIYVGLMQNLENDLDFDHDSPDNIVAAVGEEGEQMLVWLPEERR